jgi:putative inorganic carbon (hco3(-)) transporter
MLRQNVIQGLWILVAVFAGIVIATQPLPLALLIIGFVLLSITTAFTPLATLSVLLILAPLRTLFATEATFTLPLDAGQLMFVAFVLGWGAWHIIQRKPLFALQTAPIVLPLIIFIIATGLTVFTAFSLHVWVSEWLKWLIILILVLLVSRFDDNSTPQWLTFILVISATANAIIGLYIFFGGSGADHLLINGRFFRAFGTFGQPNPFGGFMGLILPLAIMSVWGDGNRLVWHYINNHKISLHNLFSLCFYALITLILLAGLIASWSRGAWLAFMVSVAAMGFALPRKLWQSVTLSGLIGLMVAGLWFAGLIPASIRQRVTSSTEELITLEDVRGVDITSANYAITERLAHWQAAQNMAHDHPWLGVGLGNYEVAYEKYRLLNWGEPLGHAHNYYLNILAEGGIIGLLAYLGLWGSILWFTWNARSHPDIIHRSLAIGLFGAWVYLAFHSLLDNLYVNNLFIHLGVMLGLLNIIYQQTQQSYSVEVE